MLRRVPALTVKNPQDLGAAVVFALIGLAGLYFGGDLTFGTASSMGPGYFPSIVSALILAIGVGLGIHALAVEGRRIEPIRLRPLAFVIAAIIIFGYALDAVGLGPTALVLTIVAAYARRDVNLLETFVLGGSLAVFTIVVFVYALSQPLPAWWGR